MTQEQEYSLTDQNFKNLTLMIQDLHERFPTLRFYIDPECGIYFSPSWELHKSIGLGSKFPETIQDYLEFIRKVTKWLSDEAHLNSRVGMMAEGLARQYVGGV